MQVTVSPEWTKVIAFFIPCRWARELNKNDELINACDCFDSIFWCVRLIVLISPSSLLSFLSLRVLWTLLSSRDLRADWVRLSGEE